MSSHVYKLRWHIQTKPNKIEFWLKRSFDAFIISLIQRAWLNVMNHLLYCVACKIFYSTESLIFAWTKKVFCEIFINFSIWLRSYSPTCPHPELCNMYKLNLTRLGLFKSIMLLLWLVFTPALKPASGVNYSNTVTKLEITA